MPYRKLKYLPTIRKIPDDLWDEILVAERISGTLLEKIISSFTILTKDDNYSLE